MKVTLINTSDAGGGAPAACMRLLNALAPDGVDVHLLAQNKYTAEERVEAVADDALGELKAKIDFYCERIPFILFHERDETVRFAFSTAPAGSNISDNHLVRNADVLHLHWTNSGFLSIKNIRQLIALNKPVVWTLHDMWAFTGGCHYSGDCDRFLNECGNCPLLKDASDNDISRKGWKRKKELYAGVKNLVFVTCSNWLAEVARSSSLLKDFRIEAIPNPIDTDLYSPQNKSKARAKLDIAANAKVILFGAANINHTRKGITYLVEALYRLKADYPQPGNIEVVIFGKNKGFDIAQIPFKVHQLGIINSQSKLAEIYSLADVFVLPSLEDNLPNMVMEALACGTPVVAFNTGGLPDLVDHKQNGYLAAYKSAEDMAKGIDFVLNSAEGNMLSSAARNKVVDNFSNEIVAAKYKALYQSIRSSS
ncbi:glycosyltransferase family 4 protein [Mucilaginibacter sp. HMF5004]|uniref:glycosyltransferase family 4 protein n=1 Tax=Mucilaginibacter rivuli TaxID=2857527 RepID=UPI001C5FAB85|nr:glycosyltransferase family 4 protein [Mucilaginibacter rivuli]MBW4890544.1 glycosyltransferase family 4 protein [Mucilaginibacter rivuli]